MSNFWADFSRVSAPARTVRPSRFWQEWEQAESSQRQQPAIERMIAEAAGRYRVPVDLAIALARAESGLDPAARSRAGAIGVMQLMPSTAKQLGVNPYDVRQNIEGGIRYLRQMYDRFGDWRLAVAAYNAGPGAVQKYGGIPPFPETKAHVERVFSILAPTGRLRTEEERRGAGQRLMQSIQERREREQREIREILEREFGGGQLSEQALRASPALRMAVDIPRHLIRGAIPILPIRTTREEAEVRGRPIEAFGRFGPQVQVPVPGGQTIRIQPSVEGILGAGAEMLGATLAFGPFVRAARAIAPGLVSALERLPLRYALGNITLGTLVGALQGAADVAEDVRQGKISPQEAARQVAMQAGLTGAAFGALHAALSGTFHLVRAGRLSVRKLRELADSAREAARRVEQPAAAPAAPIEQRPPQLEAPPPARPTPRPAPEAAPRPDRPAGITPAPEAPPPPPAAPEPKPPAARPPAQPEAAPPAVAKPLEPPPARPVAPARVEPERYLSPEVSQALPRVTVDTRWGQADALHRLVGGFEPQRRVIVAYHVTTDPDVVIRQLKAGSDLRRTARSFGDLGRGFYVSGAPEMWVHRGRVVDKILSLAAENKRVGDLLDFVEREIARREDSRYITRLEAQRARELISMTRAGRYNVEVLSELFGQPYNIGWENAAEAIGISPKSVKPHSVRVELAGRFLDMSGLTVEEQEALWVAARRAAQEASLLDAAGNPTAAGKRLIGRGATEPEIRNWYLQQLGYDGAFTKAGMTTSPQLVVWNPEAVRAFGEWRNPRPAPRARAEAAPREAPQQAAPAPEQIQPPAAEAPPSQIQAETGEPPNIRVSRTVLRTARGSQEQASLAVVDLGEVVTSHTPEGLPRPEYVQHGGVQPRARERAASRAQIARIAQTLEPERLVLDTSDPATGSPVVAPSVRGGAWVVESGNARVAALELASRRYPDRYAAYLEAVKERLRAHGQDPSIIDEMVSRGQRPVLVRIRESNLHPEGRARFAAEANEPSVLKMSPSEQARSDAAMISDELMGELRVGEDIASPANRPFVRAFMSRLPLEEQAAMLTESGELSRAGADRIRAAILARAYGDEKLLQLSLEDLDPAVTGILNTLASVAGRVARFRALVSQQAAYRELDISQDLARAAVTLNRLIRQRENVDNWLAQTQLLSEESDLTRAIVRLMHGMRRSHRKLGLILDRYYDMAERAGGPGAPTLPGFERPAPPSAAELLDRAAESLRADQTELLRVLSPVPPEARGRSAFAPQGAESVKIHEIVARLEDAFSVPIRLGRFPALLSSRVAGFYKRIPQVIRRKVYGDLQTIYHELGHHLDNLFKLSQPDAPYAQELLSLFETSGLDPSAYPSLGARLKEGVAEFVRMLYTDPERLPQVAPQFHAHFWKVVGTHDRLADALTKSIRDYQRWVSQPAWAMVSSMIEDSPGARGPKTPFFWRLYEEWVNDIAPLDRMLRELGIPRGEQPNPASLAQLMRGWVGQAEVFIERGIRDRKGTLLAPSLREVLEPVADRLDEFRIYAVARRAAELMDRGKPTGFEQLRPQITQVLVEGAQRGYDKVLDRLVQWQNALVQATLVDSGLMSPELAKAIFAKNTAYIPFYRMFDESGWTAVRAGAGLMNVRSPVKRLVGSTRPVEDPLVNILANTYAYTQAAAKQRVLLALTKLTRYPGAGKWIEKVPAPSVATRVSIRRVLEAAQQHLGPEDARELNELLEALGSKLSSEYVTLFDPARWPGRKEAREHVIAVSYQGKLSWYQIHPDVYRFLAQNPSEAMANVFVRVLGPIARTLRAGAVLAFDFIVRNLIRDQFVAAVQSRYGYMPFVDLARGMFHALGKTDVWELWASSGASGAALAALDRNFLRGQLNSILGRGGMGRVVAKYASLESLRALSELVENSTRIGEFARALRQEAKKYGVEPTWRGLASLKPEVREEILAKAALSAREVTIDFSRAGRSGRVINAVSAFWNARMQGLDRLARAFRDDPYGATARAVLWVTMPSIALWWLNKDNPEYQELPEWRKVAFWHLPVPWWDGRVHLIPVPKPFELGILFGGLPEAVLEWVYRKDPEAVRARISALVAQPVSDLLAGFFPTAVQPVVEAVANYSFFRDRPIVPMSEQRLPPELQYGPYQTEAAKGMAQLVKRLTGVGVSPRVIEHLVRGYLGSLGMTALGLPDIVLGSTRGSLVAPIERVPGLSAFVERPYAEPESVRRFYRRLRSLEQAHAGEQAAAGIRGLTPPPELAIARTTQRELAELRNMIQAILTDPSLPTAEKHRIVRDLTLQMIAAARAASGLPQLEQRP